MNFVQNLKLPFREDKLTSVVAFLFFLVPLAFSVFSYENFETLKYGLWMVLFGWALALTLQKVFSNGESRFKINKYFFLWLGLFWGWAIIATVFSSDKLNSIFGFYYRFTSSVAFYTIWAGLAVILLQILDLQRVKFLSKILALTGFLVAFIGLLQAMGIGFYDSQQMGGILRSPSLLGNPNFSAMFVVTVLPFVVVLFSEAKNLSSKIYYAFLILTMLLSVFIFASRGALVSLFTVIASGILLLFYFKFSNRLKIKLLAAVFCTVILGLFVIQVSRPQILSNSLNTSDQNVNLRLQVWKITFQGIVKQSWVGEGPGNFQVFFEKNRPNYLPGQSGVFDDAHNLFLHLGATGGLPILFGFIGLIASAFFCGFKSFKNNRDLWSLAGLLSLVGFITAALFTPVSVGCFLLLDAVLAFLIYPHLKEYKLNMNLAGKFSLYFIAIFAVVIGILLITSEHIFLVGYQRYFQGRPDITYKLSKISTTLNPTNQLFKIYFIGSKIQLGDYSSNITDEIENLSLLHRSGARVFVSQSNLYSLMYRKSNDIRFLLPAIQKLKNALEIDPFFAERYGQLGLYYYEMGNLEQSLQYLNQSLALKFDQFPVWVLKARIYQEQGRRQQVLYSLEKAYMLKPEVVQIKYLLEFAKREPDIKKVPIQINLSSGKLD